MTNKARVEWVKWTTFVVVSVALTLGLSLLSQRFWSDADANSLIRSFTTLLALFVAQVAAHFAVRLVPGTQAPQLDTQIFKRLALSQPLESGQLTVESPTQTRLVLRIFAILGWVLSLLLLGILTGVLIPIEQQRGREWGIPLVIFFGVGGLFLWFVNLWPALKIDARGVSIGKKLIAWREISQCEIHTRTDELGEVSSVTLHLKNQFGVALGTVTVAPTEAERQRLMHLVCIYLGAEKEGSAAPVSSQ